MNKELQYIVKPEEQMVICIGRNCAADLYNDLMASIENTSGVNEVAIYAFEPLIRLNDSYKGVVKVRPGDVFDEEVGKREARKKMLYNYTRAKVRAYDRVISAISNLATEINTRKNKYQIKVDAAHNKVDIMDIYLDENFTVNVNE